MFTSETSTHETSCDDVQPECSQTNGESVPLNPGGAPAHNQNRVSNGLSSLAKNGRVPSKAPGSTYIRRQTRALNRAACAAFEALHARQPGFHETMLLKALSRAEARAMLHEKMLDGQWGDMTHEQRTASLAAVDAAGDRIVKCSKQLGLDKSSKAHESPEARLMAALNQAGGVK